MANEKILIDANRLKRRLERFEEFMVEFGNVEAAKATRAIINGLKIMPTVDAVEVVFCDECENHGNCYPETIFRLARIEKPFCCVGKRKTNTNCGAKMDGDGNG